MAVYLSELRALADQCEFEGYLETALRDRLIAGIADDRFQRRLLQEPYKDLTLAKAVDIAVTMETASKNVMTMQEAQHRSPAVSVHAVPQQHSHRGNNRDVMKPQSTPSGVDQQCWRCGGQRHKAADCKCKSAKCHKCGQEGHIGRKCRKGKDGKRQPKRDQRVHQVESDNMTSYFEDAACIYSVTEQQTVSSTVNKQCSVPPFTRFVTVYGQKVTLEVDSGSGVTLINSATFEALKRRHPSLSLTKPEVDLHTYTGGKIQAMGQVILPVIYKSGRKYLKAYVVGGQGPNLLGRSWMAELGIGLSQVNAVEANDATIPDDIRAILQEFSAMFDPSLGTYSGPPVHLDVDETASPKFCKARPVPFALRDKVDVEIDRLVKEGIYKPVPYSRWATPLVPVLKANGQVRLCGDYKCTVNKSAKREVYAMPTVEEMFSKLANSSLFCKIDLSQAFQQLALDEQSQELVTVNTSKELFYVTRLTYGVSSSPAIFQREMESLLSGIPGVVYFIDDVLVSASTMAKLKQRLREILSRLAHTGLCAQLEKCVFAQTSVTYLGYRIDKDGLHPTEEKVKALTNAPEPSNVSQLRQFIGLIMYYSRFIDNHAQLLGPLYDLLRKDVHWQWGQRE